MKIIGITAEYNPFHNGHKYHIKKTREQTEADYVIAVMSGNFTQRGELAITDKIIRARAAVECGVNLGHPVIAIYSCIDSFYWYGKEIQDDVGNRTK